MKTRKPQGDEKENRNGTDTRSETSVYVFMRECIQGLIDVTTACGILYTCVLIYASIVTP